MARAKRICSKPGCPVAGPAGLCPAHQAEADKARGTKTQRGYGPEHQAERKRQYSLVQAGTVRCARCRELIRPGDAWHLDHDDDDRTRYIGPSHARCNTSAGGRAAHR